MMMIFTYEDYDWKWMTHNFIRKLWDADDNDDSVNDDDNDDYVEIFIQREVYKFWCTYCVCLY